MDGDANLAGNVDTKRGSASGAKYSAVTWFSLQGGAGGVTGNAERLGSAPVAGPGLSAARDAEPVADGIQLVLPALRAPVLDAARTIPVSRDASELWVQVRAAAAARYSPTHRAYVEDLVAFDLGGDTLTCVTSTEFTLRMLESAGLAGIETELSAASAGAVSRLHVEAFQPGRHTR